MEGNPMNIRTLSIEPTLQVAFHVYPKTLAELRRLQEVWDDSLVEGMAHMLQVLATRPVKGVFRLSEKVLARLVDELALQVRIDALVGIFLVEEAS